MVEKRNLGSTKRIITLTDILLQQIVLHVSYIIEAAARLWLKQNILKNITGG